MKRWNNKEKQRENMEKKKGSVLVQGVRFFSPEYLFLSRVSFFFCPACLFFCPFVTFYFDPTVVFFVPIAFFFLSQRPFAYFVPFPFFFLSRGVFSCPATAISVYPIFLESRVRLILLAFSFDQC